MREVVGRPVRGRDPIYQSTTDPSSASYALAVPPVVADLVGQGVLVELDAQAGAGGQVEVAVADARTASSGSPRPG